MYSRQRQFKFAEISSSNESGEANCKKQTDCVLLLLLPQEKRRWFPRFAKSAERRGRCRRKRILHDVRQGVIQLISWSVGSIAPARQRQTTIPPP